MDLEFLDQQLLEGRRASEVPNLPDAAWNRIATTIAGEVEGLATDAVALLLHSLPVAPERYREELVAFQAWMNLAHDHRDNPVVVRAQVMTQLYVSFVWLRDSVMRPVAAALPPDSVFVTVEDFLRTGQRRLLRNAIAHGRWCYLPDFSGLEYWAEPTRGVAPSRYEVSGEDLETWQLLSRGTAIAALLALEEHRR